MSVLPLLREPAPVWRNPADLQILTPKGPLVLRGVPDAMATAVNLFDGLHTDTDLESVLGPDWTPWLVDTLTAHEAFAAPAPAARHVARVVDPGPLARRLAVSLDRAGLLASPTRGRGRSAPRPGAPSVVVLAPPYRQPDRVIVERLAQAGTPHLVVTATDSEAQVGPFVMPDVTSCLGCADRRRQSLDSAWVLTAFQYMRTPVAPDPILSAWAVATATSHIRAYAEGRVPESASSTVTLSRDGVVTYASWPRHPECPHHEAAVLSRRNAANTVVRSVVSHKGGMDATRNRP